MLIIAVIKLTWAETKTNLEFFRPEFSSFPLGTAQVTLITVMTSILTWFISLQFKYIWLSYILTFVNLFSESDMFSSGRGNTGSSDGRSERGSTFLLDDHYLPLKRLRYALTWLVEARKLDFLVSTVGV